MKRTRKIRRIGSAVSVIMAMLLVAGLDQNTDPAQKALRYLKNLAKRAVGRRRGPGKLAAGGLNGR